MFYLTPNEIHLAASHAVRRRVEAIEKKRKQRGDEALTRHVPWDNEIEAACAELAYCKDKGIYWTGVTAIRAPDCGGVDVRWTVHKDKGGLPVLPDDQGALVLLDGFAPNYSAVGWLRANEGKRPEWWVNKWAEYLVPREYLHPMPVPHYLLKRTQK